jgi:hypothetical protein
MVSALVATLRRRGLFDDALIVLTSDHGYRRPVPLGEEGSPQRSIAQTLSTLAVPLLVKTPGQTRGESVATPVRSVDVLPMILAELGMARPSQVEGVLPGPGIDDAARRRFLRVHERRDHANGTRLGGAEIQLDPEILAHRSTVAALQAEAFGAGGDPRRLYRHGEPRPDLFDRSYGELPVRPAAETKVWLAAPSELRFDARSGEIPAALRGRIVSGPGGPECCDVVVLLNGRVEVTARPEPARHGVVPFSVVIPEVAFRPGKNEVALLLAHRRTGELLAPTVERAKSRT